MIVAMTIAAKTPARVDYLRQVRDSWVAVDGVDQAHFEFHVEPSALPEALALCDEFNYFTDARIVSYNAPQGVLAMPYNALTSGFSKQDFIVLTEEDVVVSTDVLTYMRWCRDEFKGSPILAANAFSRPEEEGSGRLYKVRRDSTFSALCWGTWRDRWESELQPGWLEAEKWGGWDWWLRHDVLPRGYQVIHPYISRSDHIGEQDGTFTTAQTFPDDRSLSFRRLITPSEFSE